jgi:deazaflavin-dependent oxidoreductase (nitroreductase family)
MADVNDFNAQFIDEFRANAGVVGGQFEGAIEILTTTGAKSGLERVNPVVCRVEGDAVYVFASKTGASTNPDWFHNLVVNPSVTAELRSETFAAKAEVVERGGDRVYTAQASVNPGFAEHEAMTDRIIPVVRLVRS